ncbi:uncharacterized protein [Heterodontus francisci]|uniref:uncharacterized protein isoform X4 n=1 Tax=Heterodontus francisci TaxID=7792 RepID=UPI00355B5DEB
MNGLKDAHKQAAMLVTFFITVRLCENGVYAVHVTTILGDKINLNCLTNQSPKEITLVKWSRSITAASQDIASYNADYGLFKFFKDDRLTVSSYNGTCLQIQPVYLTDEGNYTCEITAFTGIFRDHFSLSVLGDNTKMMSPQIKFILITCASAMAVVGTVLLVIWIMKKKMKKIAKPATSQIDLLVSSQEGRPTPRGHSQGFLGIVPITWHVVPEVEKTGRRAEVGGSTKV